MRILCLAGIAALTLTSPTYAAGTNLGQLPGTITPYAPGDEIMPNVLPGDQIAIACGALEQRSADSDVRVVLTISAVPGESGPGYKKVLATDAQLLKDAVRVRIPSVPDLAEHTVDLNVYVVDDKGSQQCDAGHMKIS
jgi:hypothetical protein